jgi:VIT1/CCC1 family predicted Fe2+/Mn2+ transporter
MTLTFTLGAGLTIQEEGSEGARQLLIATIGCNIAWGVIDDVMGGIASSWLVFFASLPAAIPFLLINDAFPALRVSNAILLGLLFWAGFSWARYTTARPGPARPGSYFCFSGPPSSPWP